MLLGKKIYATLILKMDRYSETLKCQKFDTYIKTGGVLIILSHNYYVTLHITLISIILILYYLKIEFNLN